MSASDLQRAIYAKLTGDAVLMGMITGVFAQREQVEDDENPATFPCVTIGQDVFSDESTKDDVGELVDCQIDVWSRKGNYLEAKDIGSRIKDVLHMQPLTIANANHIQTIVSSQNYTPDPDGVTKHGVILARVMYFAE